VLSPVKTYSAVEPKRALFTIGLIAKHFDFADIAVETTDVCILLGLHVEELHGNGNGINLQKTHGFPDLTVIQPMVLAVGLYRIFDSNSNRTE